MSETHLILFALVFIGMKSYSQAAVPELRNWSFKSSGDSSWIPCSIPGNSMTALLESKLIEDPNFGDREKELQWISERNWWFKSTLIIDSFILASEHIDLICPTLDPGCSVYINGSLAGIAINEFRKWTFPAKDLLKSGENTFEFHFESPKKLADSLYANLNPLLPGGSRVVLRKTQCQFGWDFGPCFLTSGLEALPKLVAWNQVFLEDASIQTLSILPNQAELELLVHFGKTDPQEQKLEFELEIADRKFIFFKDYTAGKHAFKHVFSFPDPKLWWPNGMGSPHLYPCSLSLLVDGKKIQQKIWNLGIRTLELDQQNDSSGRAFRFLVNSKPVFCKGSNYIPADLLRQDSKTCASLLESAVLSNFNMIRIWGGGRYETENFYNTCDEKGLMVWHDFMFACGMYPGDSIFLENVEEEARQQVIRLAKHACLALWCGNNENNEGWHRWGWQSDMTESHREKLWDDYKKLFREILPRNVAAYSPQTAYWESSPLFGRGDERFKTQGDAHDWGLWHDELPFSSLEQRIPRFMSEFGFQSLPNLTTIRSFAPDDQLSLDSKALLNHQKHPRGNKLIQSYIEREYPPTKDFESLVYLNQVCQAEGIERIIRSHRKAKPYCMGSLYWQFNDCWPGISWSGIDYFGRWKALQHAVKNAFEPLSFYVDHTGEEIRIYALNDLQVLVPVRIEYRIQDFFGNAIRYHSFTDSLPPDSTTQLASIYLNVKRIAADRSHYMLVQWESPYGAGQTTLFFDVAKNLKLPKALYRMSDFENTEHGFRFSISSDQFARSVYLEETEDLQFFPNYFNLNPQSTQQIECKTTKMWQDVHIVARSLNDLLTENNKIK